MSLHLKSDSWSSDSRCLFQLSKNIITQEISGMQYYYLDLTKHIIINKEVNYKYVILLLSYL